MLNFYTFTHFSKVPSLLHAITTKASQSPFDFSLALHTGEKKSHILANRQDIVKYFQRHSSLDFIVANQTHSENIHIVRTKQTKGWYTAEDCIEDCDALITNIPNVVLGILTADCVPILLFDPKKQVIAAIHAGWKGTKSEILAKTVTKMQEEFASNPKDILAGIAPSIGCCCYEVENDVAKYFTHIKDAYTVKKDKYMLDLPYINKRQLLKSGLLETHIEMSHICTACEVDRFFSYRKEQGCSGRFMSMIALKQKMKDNDED